MQIVINLLRGVAVGLANIIPGVSGGTMALVLGIYERLIQAIGNIGVGTVKSVFKGREAFMAEMKRIDAFFLGTLAVGAIITVVGVASVMAMLLKDYHDPTYGFFFGLVLASVVVPYRMIRRKSAVALVSGLVAVFLVVGLSMAVSGDKSLEKARNKKCAKIVRDQAKSALVTGKEAAPPPAACAQVAAAKDQQSRFDVGLLVLFFLAGVIAISAMILPGISGSFMLLLMGIYFDMLTCINQVRIGITARHFGEIVEPGLLLGVFSVGCLVGLVVFTRLLKFLLERYSDVTLAFLTGLIIGSMYAIWPFKHSKWDLPGPFQEKVFLDNTLPTSFDTNVFITLAATLAGFMIVVVFMIIETKQEKSRAK